MNMQSSYSNLNIELVETSFEKIKPRAVDFVSSFYQNLFEAYPETQYLFTKTNMDKQGKKLINSLVLLVEGLRTPELLVPVLKDLGARHKGYGTVAEYYPLVGEILLNTFAQYLQEDWTPEVAQAWLDIYTMTSQLMLEGAGVEVESVSVKQQEQSTPSPPPISISLAKEETPQFSTNVQIELVERSFEKIKPHTVEFVSSFYANLFEAYPEIKHLFGKTDMDKQGKKLINSLILLVEGLRTPQELIPVLKDLGARHKGYGILTEYYPLMGDILMATLADYLQEDWVPDVEQAWLNIYKKTYEFMLEGAGNNIISGSQNPVYKSIHNPIAPQIQKEVRPDNNTANKRYFNQVIRLILKILKSIQNSFKYIFKAILDWFWRSPTWVVAITIAFLLVILVVFTPNDSVLSKLLSDVEPISIIVAIILYVKEIPDRKKEFQYQAWSVIDAAHGVKVSPARIIALQDLNEDGVALNNLDLPGAKLVRINLPKADLSEANLTKSDLNHANLNHTNLGNALLARVNLTGANLSYANLGFAKLSYANLSSADLSYANLICADLRDANLSGANLSNGNLSGADLKNAYLTGANLTGANVSQYDLRGAYLKGAIMPDGSKHP